MQGTSLRELVGRGSPQLRHGPLALIFAEDGVELAATLDHHRMLGFPKIVLFVPPGVAVPPEAEGTVVVAYDTMDEDAVPTAVNAVIEAAPEGTWLFYCYNAEYLFFPFCDTRSIGELLAFHAEERREAMVTYVVDLYARDLGRFPDAVARDDAHLDRTGYYALTREDPAQNHRPLERQMDFYGGLRWRFEEHVPYERRRIDRVGLFRARKGLRLSGDHLFNDPEYNTYACPWHHNVTAAICSFRTAKALRTNPGSRAEIGSFHWHNSVAFDWTPQQLLDLGLMEPGQWF